MKKIISFLIVLFVVNLSSAQVIEQDFSYFPRIPTTTVGNSSTVNYTHSGNWRIFNEAGSFSWGESQFGPTSYGELSCFEQSGGKDWLISPVFTLPAVTESELRIGSFFYSNSQLPSGSSLKVFIGDNPNDVTTINSTPIFEFPVGTTNTDTGRYRDIYSIEYLHIPIPSIYRGQQKCIFFLVDCTNSSSFNSDSYWVLRDFSVGCAAPRNVIVDKHLNSVDFSWTCPENISHWEIRIGDSYNNYPGNIITVNQPSINISTNHLGQPLSSGEGFYLNIRSVCDDGLRSDWQEVGSYCIQPGEECEAPFVATLPFVRYRSPLGYNEFINYSYRGSNPSNCGTNASFYFTDRQTIYSYTPSVTEDIDIKVVSLAAFGIFLYDDCANLPNNCIASATNNANNTALISNFHALAGHTYYALLATPETPKGYPAVFTMTKSNACVNGIQASFTAVSDTNIGRFNVSTNILSFDGSLSLVAKCLVNGVVTASQTINELGTYQFGPFSGIDNVNILLEKPQNPSCFLLSNILTQYDTNACVQTIGTVNVSQSGNCQNVQGSLQDRSLSNVTLQNCSPQPVVDAWYDFTATSSEQHIVLTSGSLGNTNLKFAVYKKCPDLEQLYCSSGSQGTVTGLTVGQIYRIRVYATSFSDNLDFNLCVSGAVTTCADNNPQFPTIKHMFINLINHLWVNKDQIAQTGNGYTCSQLSLLAPYITIANPSINNFVATPNSITFSFSNHGGNNDLKIYFRNATDFISNFLFMDQFSVSSQTPIRSVSGNIESSADYLNSSVDNGFVTFVNFCPSTTEVRCLPEMTGNIVIAGGGSCVSAQHPTLFTVTTSRPTNHFTWTFTSNGSTIETVTTTVPSITRSFSTYGDYQVSVVAEAQGCSNTFRFIYTVSKICPDQCADNVNSTLVKGLFINLVNHLLDLYPGGENITLPYTCPQLTALAPYINDVNPAIQSMSYDYSTNILNVSFGTHSGYDISIKDLGAHVSDINIIDVTSDTSLVTTLPTVYENGSIVANSVRHVKFCNINNNCEDYAASILLNTSCLNTGNLVNISYLAPVSDIQSAHWTITQNNAVVVRNDNNSFTYTLPAAGEYIISLKLVRSGGCVNTFTKTININSASTNCNPICQTVTNVNIYPTGECTPVAGSLSSGFSSNPNDIICGQHPTVERWYSFQATANTQHIQLAAPGNLGTQLRYALYTGSCNSLTLMACGNENQTTLNNFIIGNTYFVRVYAIAGINPPLDFELCVTGPTATCIDNLASAKTAKGLFVNLINHLIANSSAIQGQSQPYTCNELTALAPYITDAAPTLGIYNLTATPNSLSFSFANHGIDRDVTVFMQTPGYISDFEYIDDYSVNGSLVKYIQGDANTSQDLFYGVQNEGRIRHIDFCKDISAPCTPAITGDIILATSSPCIVQGESTSAYFPGIESNVSVVSWTVKSYDGTYSMTYPGTGSVNITFPSAGSYIIKLMLSTSVFSTCYTEIYKTVTVNSTCTDVPSLTCPEDESLYIKNLYKSLVNHLLDLYPATPVSQGYTCAELSALSSHLSDQNPGIYNALYDYNTNTLRFSFGNHAGYDVVVKDYGVPIADIDISTYTVPENTINLNTVYVNGLTDTQNAVRHVKFCASDIACPEYSVSIVAPNATDCLPGGLSTFTYLTSAPSISTVTWKLFQGTVDGTQLMTGNADSFAYNFTEGTYTLTLDISYSASCKFGSSRTFTVLANGVCAVPCEGATTLPVSSIGNCSPTTGSFSNASLSTVPLTNCTPAPIAEVWYEFVATSSVHYIQLSGINGQETHIKFALYTGNCNNLTQVYCSDNISQTMVNNLIPGETYKVRVYTTSVNTPNSFLICVSGSVSTCADTNSRSPQVKQLFINLINYVIANRDNLPRFSGFNCPELMALAPYIAVESPRIYSLRINNDVITFNFSLGVYGSSDVTIHMPPSGYYQSFAFTSTFDVNQLTSLQFARTNDDYYHTEANLSGQVRKINFCPDIPCNTVITGLVTSSVGESCVLAGSAVTFTFTTQSNVQSAKTWILKDSTGNLIRSYVGSEFLLNGLSTIGMYDLEVTVSTASGCRETFHKEFEIKTSCDSQSCTEQNPNTIKALYLALINKLLALYPQNPVTSPYNCEELVALLPYLNTDAEMLYNVQYDPATQILSFSFGDHAGYDVAVKDIGVPVSNLLLSGFTSADQAFMPRTIYNNGHVEMTHSIKGVDFCQSIECPSIYVSIEMADGLSCVMQNVAKRFLLQTTATNINSYTWKFLDSDNTTVLFSQSNVSSLEFSYPTAGNYLIQLDVTYNNGCTGSFYKNLTVLRTGSINNCSTYCTETNDLSADVKQKYIALLNRVITTCLAGNTIVNGTGISEVSQLEPYLVDTNPGIYNLSFNTTTRIAKFSFAPHGVNYDVELFIPNKLNIHTPFINFRIPYRVSDVNLLNYNANDEGLQTLAITYELASNPYSLTVQPITSLQHKVRHVDFCPGIICIHQPGAIALETGLSCVQTNNEIKFKYMGNSTHISDYTWNFYDRFGAMIGAPVHGATPVKIYNEEGTYKVTLSIRLDDGCLSTYTKTITVSNTCTSFCTETNERSSTASNAFVSMINDIFTQQSLPATGYLSDKVDDMIQFITDNNPRIYNAVYSGQTLSFSFSQNSTSPDVVIKNYGLVTDINFVGYTTSGNYTTAIVSYANGSTDTAQIKHVNFCPAAPECRKHISFVLDESGSISEEEGSYIKMQLTNFVQQQHDFGAETYISFIGMSDSDNDTRHDHIYSQVTTDDQVRDFKNWLQRYKAGYTSEGRLKGITPNSDYWASGLKTAMTQDIRPDVVVVITDGSQTANLQNLKNIIRDIRSNSHLYVYGIGSGSYVDLDPLRRNANNDANVRSEVTGKLIASLKYLFELPSTDFPVSNRDDIDRGDFYEYANFNDIALDKTYFSDKMARAHYGCGGQVTPKVYCDDCETFQPEKGNYFITGWVKELVTYQVTTYANALVKLRFTDSVGNETGTSVQIFPSGDIIDGWQRFAMNFSIPENTSLFSIELVNASPGTPVFFDDIRLHPIDGSMKTFVYDPETFKLAAELDDNNYSTFYEYDKEGSLIRVKKETSQGVKTIQESRSGNKIKTTTN
ncbi:PKD domain-containing protein [Flavobacterium sp. RNTU_13]|uniref:PKD domain-containing protein n=1 Tax=Flavobacterium sp. RNTU_13 TaxID=3375145 RepID=UPI003986B63A